MMFSACTQKKKHYLLLLLSFSITLGTLTRVSISLAAEREYIAGREYFFKGNETDVTSSDLFHWKGVYAVGAKCESSFAVSEVLQFDKKGSGGRASFHTKSVPLQLSYVLHSEFKPFVQEFSRPPPKSTVESIARWGRAKTYDEAQLEQWARQYCSSNDETDESVFSTLWAYDLKFRIRQTYLKGSRKGEMVEREFDIIDNGKVLRRRACYLVMDPSSIGYTKEGNCRYRLYTVR